MKIVNIAKDGTIIEDLSKVVVPKDIVRSVHEIAKRKTEVRGKTKNGNKNTS